MGQLILPQIQIFQKVLETEKNHKILMETYKESMKKKNMGQTVSSFDRNSQKTLEKQN